MITAEVESRCRRFTVAMLSVLASCPAAGLGQEAAGPAAPADPMARPTEYAIRFTPEIASAEVPTATKRWVVIR